MSKTIIEQPQSVNGAFDDLLNKMYISNVQNRLRQLNEPTDNDSKRWVWELIQNAKDSISHDESRNTVDIRLRIRDKEVKFSHNGSPFTAKAQLGLLYKYSEGKVNNSESTGRFGTGFLTTHTLSKIVSIEGDVYTDDVNNSLCGFSATMYRDGLDEPELLEGVKKMKESLIYTKEINSWTTYTYHLRTPQNEHALQLGLENFITNIAQTMLFCKELNSVELDNNGIITKIIRKENQLLYDDIFLTEFEINSETSFTRKFIYKILSEHSLDLSKRFKTERNIRLTASIEIDSNNNVLENKDNPSHYCILPLVGSERHIMPIYLNSPDFEPDSERESLILIGDDILADKDVISEGGINRLILKESITLYESLVSYLAQTGYHNLHLLAKGLKTLPKFDKNFNKEWFEQEIIIPYRDVLKKYAVVETTNGYQKLFTEDNKPNIIIPKDTNLEKQTRLYDLSAELFPDKLPLESIATDWAEVAWKDCGLLKIKNLCEYVADQANVDNLKLKSSKYDWLNSFLSFIKETDESLLKEFTLIPNRKGDFISLENEEFSEGSELTDYMIEVLNAMGEDLTPILLSNHITSINLPRKIDAKTISEKINDQVDRIIKDKNLSVEEIINGLLPLINTLPTDETKYNTDFISKQKQINYFSKILYPDLQIEEYVNNEIPEKAWQACHKWLISQLMQTVSEYKKIDMLPATIENKTEWINSFIAFVLQEIKEGGLDEVAIIPNQKGNFCYKKDLAKDINIPKAIKSERAEKFGIKLKDSLLHEDIDSIRLTNEKSINTVIEIINTIFKNNQFEEEDDYLGFAIFLIHFIPEETSQLLYNSQKQLLNIVREYYHNGSNSNFPITIPCNVEDFWSKANDYIVRSLQEHIETESNVETLKVFLSTLEKTYDDGDTIIFLNNFYDYLKNSNRSISKSIVPNQNGVFCSLDGELYKDENIPDQLKEILFLVNPVEDFRNILADTSLSIQPPHVKKTADIAKIIDDSIKETYSNPKNWDNDNFKKAIHSLMIEWFPTYKGKESEEYFNYTFRKKETIEMNVLWSLEERQRMQRARSVAPELLDQFIETSGGINTLNKEKEALEAKIAELKSQIENSTFDRSAQEIIKEFPNITADRIRELLQLEEQIKNSNSYSSSIQQSTSTVSLYPIGSEDDIMISASLFDGSCEKSRISVSEEAKDIIFLTLRNKGFNVSDSIDINYTIVNGVINPEGKPINIVIKSAKAGKIYFNPNEWLALTHPDSQLFVVTRGNQVRNITLADIESINDVFHMRFNTRAFAMTNLNVLANFFRYLPYTHFIFDSPESTTNYLQQFGLSDRNKTFDQLNEIDKQWYFSKDDANTLH